MPWGGWIPKDRDPSEPWDGLLEKLKPLRAEFAGHAGKPSNIEAWMRKTCHQARSDWIAHQRHDDRDDGSRALRGTGANRTVYDHHIDLAADQICDQLRHQNEIAVGGAPFDHYIASLSISGGPYPLPERLRFLAVE